MKKKYKTLGLYGVLFLIFGVVGYFGAFWLRKPMISVVMSTYNRSALLPLAIHSILAQTYGDFELIIINDGSTDGTEQVLKQFADKDSRIVVLKNETNKGLSYSLNRGLERAKGKFIARMDDDDFSIPNRFAVQLDFMEKNPDVVVVGAPRFVNLENDQYLRTKQLELYMKSAEVPHIVQENDAAYNAIRTYFEVPFLHPSAFIRKDFLDTHGIRYKEIYESAEDTAFWFEITQKGGKIIQSDVPLVLRGKAHKKKGYHVRQLSSYHRFLEYSVSEVYELPKEKNRWLTHDEVCGILTGLEKYIGYKPFITESTLEYAKLKQKCQ